MSYQSLLIVSFGGPEGPDEVMPFLRNVLRGKPVPEARMQEVAEHYQQFGGVSPINAQVRALMLALETSFSDQQINLPIYWGNRNWHPMLSDTVAQMKADGIERSLVMLTSAYSSYSGCRQYRENLQSALEVNHADIQFELLPKWYDQALFIQANQARLQEALAHCASDQPTVVFTAHSIPMAMSQGCDYVQQLTHTADQMMASFPGLAWDVVYQSRSGPPQMPWLAPDVCDHIKALHAQGVRDVLIAPIGFISDHMEVIYDLDTEAKQLCDELGMTMARAKTVGTHPAFIQMITGQVAEQLNSVNNESHFWQTACRPGCCESGRSSK